VSVERVNERSHQVREVEEGAALLGRLANKAHPHPSLQSFNGPFSGPIGLGARQARGRGARAFARIPGSQLGSSAAALQLAAA